MTHTHSESVNFDSFLLDKSILEALAQMRFSQPTPVQLHTLPPALEGRNILGSAPTGSGKTGAFCIPMLHWLIQNPKQHALIMTPTRELAMQIAQFLKQLMQNQSEKIALLIGGQPFFMQKKMLRARPRIIIGTPGRINDHLSQQTLSLSQVGYLVLDEMDRMLDMGFREQIQTILDVLPEARQTLLFSATLPKHILELTKTYLSDPVRVSVGSAHVPVDTIKQTTLEMQEHQKYGNLLKQLERFPGSVIVFTKTKQGCEDLADQLREHQKEATALHGDLNQRARQRAVESFRSKKFKILVATDVAARGLDVRHVECVINFDLPQSPEDYIHRIGRTARAGAEGHAINFVAAHDQKRWRAICRLMKSGVSEPVQRSSQSRPARPDRFRPSNGDQNRWRRDGDQPRANREGGQSRWGREGDQPRAHREGGQPRVHRDGDQPRWNREGGPSRWGREGDQNARFAPKKRFGGQGPARQHQYSGARRTRPDRTSD